MIVKHIPISAIRKSSFAGLVNYLVNTQHKSERVGTIKTTNCYSDRPDTMIAEVLNTQQMNKRAQSDKSYHLVVSFHPEDNPSRESLQAIEAKLCEGLGFGEHQRISVMHHDTDNLHFHIAINKIHPTHLTIHNPHYDYKVIAALCAKLEQDYGLTVVNHEARKRGAQSAASNIEFKAGSESLIGWIQQECLAQIKAATNWADLHQVLTAHSLMLRERGNGFVFVSSNGVAVKASSVDRALSKNQLIARLGCFTPSIPPVSPVSTAQLAPSVYQKKPKRGKIDTLILYAKYSNLQNSATHQHKKERQIARQKKDQAIEQAKLAARLKRLIIKNTADAGLGKRIMYRAVHQAYLSQIQKIKAKYQDEYQMIKSSNRKVAWLDWLSQEARAGNREALEILQARTNKKQYNGNSIKGNKPVGHADYFDSIETITKNGTAILKIGATTIRDDGVRLIVLNKTEDDELREVLNFAMKQYGSRLAINGNDVFRSQVAQVAARSKLDITFDDKELEAYRLTLINQDKQETGQRLNGRAGQGTDVKNDPLAFDDAKTINVKTTGIKTTKKGRSR